MKTDITLLTEQDYMNMNLKFAYRYLTDLEIMGDMHTHSFYEYSLILSGSILHCVNGAEDILNPGDFVFIRHFDRHCYRMLPHRKCELINISFSKEYLDSALLYLNVPLRHTLLDPALPPKLPISSYSLPAFVQKHDFFNFHMPEQELVVRFRLLLLDVLSKFLLHPSPSPDPGRQKLETMFEQMNTRENIEEGLPAMLRITGFSHGHLCRVMKEALHTTPKQYLTDLRMSYASNLLVNSNMDVLSISLKVGYTSLSHFITIFKENFGITPLKYRQAHQSYGEQNMPAGKKEEFPND